MLPRRTEHVDYVGSYARFCAVAPCGGNRRGGRHDPELPRAGHDLILQDHDGEDQQEARGHPSAERLDEARAAQRLEDRERERPEQHGDHAGDQQSAERGPGSAAKYAVSYDGARIGMTVLSWNLDLDRLRAEADRCATFEAFFDRNSDGIPMTTTALTGLDDGALGYRQTMNLNGVQSSVYMAFQNVGARAVFGVAFPTGNPTIPVKASLPQTFLEIFTKQSVKLRAS